MGNVASLQGQSVRPHNLNGACDAPDTAERPPDTAPGSEGRDTGAAAAVDGYAAAAAGNRSKSGRREGERFHAHGALRAPTGGVRCGGPVSVGPSAIASSSKADRLAEQMLRSGFSEEMIHAIRTRPLTATGTRNLADTLNSRGTAGARSAAKVFEMAALDLSINGGTISFEDLANQYGR